MSESSEEIFKWLKNVEKEWRGMYTVGVGRSDSSLVPQAGRASASSSSVRWGENNVVCGFRIGKLLKIDSY